MLSCVVLACFQCEAHALLHRIIRVTVVHVSFHLQLEGVRALTNTYKQIQDNFAEQIVIYLQAAWRRYAAKKQSNTANDQPRAVQTSSFDRDFHASNAVTDADSPDDE